MRYFKTDVSKFGKPAPDRRKQSAATTTKKCLRCEKEFQSVSKFNRLCKPCNSFLDRHGLVDSLGE